MLWESFPEDKKKVIMDFRYTEAYIVANCSSGLSLSAFENNLNGRNYYGESYFLSQNPLDDYIEEFKDLSTEEIKAKLDKMIEDAG